MTGSKLSRQRRQDALDVARQVIKTHSLRDIAGVTSPDGRVVLAEYLHRSSSPR